ncbi:TOBE domain-containing protein [Actinomadura madurae]|uniref:TOBE domain-containing protein n=1 Tax=Actinomadura madurae TaxID=1993 RepID=UPI0035590A74
MSRQPITGARAVAAVRPEDFRVAGSADRAAGKNLVTVRVEVSEFHGREVAAEGVTDDGRVVHFRSPERIAPGERVTLAVSPDRVLVFGESVRDAAQALDEPAAGALGVPGGRGGGHRWRLRPPPAPRRRRPGAAACGTGSPNAAWTGSCSCWCPPSSSSACCSSTRCCTGWGCRCSRRTAAVRSATTPTSSRTPTSAARSGRRSSSRFRPR